MLSAYLAEWFHTRSDGTVGFFVPIVGVVGGSTEMIGGRHRLAVLMPHLPEFPLAAADKDRFFARIPKRRVDLNERFWIADLPIKDAL
jgi:hypothetical protein